MIDFLMIIGSLVLFLGLPVSVIVTLVFLVKKKKVSIPAICIPFTFVIGVITLGIGGYLYGQTDEYKQWLKEQEQKEKNVSEIQSQEDVNIDNVENEQETKNDTENKEEKNKTNKKPQKETLSINEDLIYDANNVKIYVKGIEESSEKYQLRLYIENNSKLNLGFNAHAYAVNKINTGNNIYDMDCDVASGKKTNAVLDIKKKFLDHQEIEELKTIDIVFWAYDNDKHYKEFDTGQISINTNLYDETYKMITGKTLYNQKGIKVDYISNNDNEYTYCLTNNTGNYIDFDVENITINDYTSSNVNYKLINISALNNCQAVFTIGIEDDFLSLNSISNIESVEFSLVINPLESYSERWNTNLILLEMQ